MLDRLLATLVAIFCSGILLLSPAYAESKLDAMKSCMKIQDNLLDSSRYGASALDYCAALVTLGSSGVNTSSNNASGDSSAVLQNQVETYENDAKTTRRKIGIINNAVGWLEQKQAADPVAAQQALDQCQTGLGQTYGELLSCMVRILGP